ncbi:MAG: DUF4271 domain-containing protein [Ferruginibacter sp.]
MIKYTNTIRGFVIVIFLFVCCNLTFSQAIDSLNARADSTIIADTNFTSNTYSARMNEHLKKNIFLGQQEMPAHYQIKERTFRNQDLFFYIIFFVLLLFGIMKMIFSRYMNTLLRVFFNTSLRQSQLTDQLLQAKLPSLIFNIFFVLMGGFYLFFLLSYLGYIDKYQNIQILFICIAAIAVMYLIKYILLKFTGWISGYKNEADTYIFIVFLINKILALALIPIVIIMAFSVTQFVKAAALLSIIFIGLMILLRFLRSYSILQNKIQVQRYYFFLYIIGLEILPLLLIYKTALKLLTNNL